MAPTNFSLKTPKGTRDLSGKDMVLRDAMFNTIRDTFKRHGAQELDTPAFELKEILSGKYGEDSKLIYDLADQGGEISSLRYDLTVPFARWLAMNNVQSIKRYHIAKVWRRDNPAIAKGRLREFYQCDIDFAGTYDSMLPDAEIFRIVKEVFDALNFKNNYTIKTNHRKILDGIFQVCGVPDDKLRAISSAVDKLDKSPWEAVRKEMVEDKGLDPAAADKIGEYVVHKGKTDLLEKLKANEELMANESAKKGLEEMSLLFQYLEAYNVTEFSFDMSLARGLDYYTGVIYEVVTEGSAPGSSVGKKQEKKGKKDKKAADDDDRSDDPSVGVGSIAAGGRYDGLVGMFSGKTQIPCVGISFGVERIYSILKLKSEDDAAMMRMNEVDVYVMALGSGIIKERMNIARTLWDAGIKAELAWKVKPKLPAQFSAAEKGGVPFAIILGDSELAQGQVKIKEMGLPEGHAEKDGVLVEIANLIPEVRRRLQARAARTPSLVDSLSAGTNGLAIEP